MKEPRFTLTDNETGKRVSLTTDEVQVVLWLAERGIEQSDRASSNGTMAAMQTERGAFYVCGECGNEIPVVPSGVVKE